MGLNLALVSVIATPSLYQVIPLATLETKLFAVSRESVGVLGVAFTAIVNFHFALSQPVVVLVCVT